MKRISLYLHWLKELLFYPVNEPPNHSIHHFMLAFLRTFAIKDLERSLIDYQDPCLTCGYWQVNMYTMLLRSIYVYMGLHICTFYSSATWYLRNVLRVTYTWTWHFILTSPYLLLTTILTIIKCHCISFSILTWWWRKIYPCWTTYIFLSVTHTLLSHNLSFTWHCKLS